MKFPDENQAHTEERDIQNDILSFIKAKHTAEHK